MRPPRTVVVAVALAASVVLAGCNQPTTAVTVVETVPAVGPTASPTVPDGVPDPEPLLDAGVTASGTADSSTDSAGNVTTYEAARALDNDFGTAWRIEGDGVGLQLVFDFDGAVLLDEVGLVPGYAKVDPASGIDRFTQNRRITSVEWDFSDGSSVVQTFEDDPTYQMINVSVETSWVRLTILGTTDHGGRDFAAISEAWFFGSRLD